MQVAGQRCAVWLSATLSILRHDIYGPGKRFKECRCAVDKNITNFFMQTKLQKVFELCPPNIPVDNPPSPLCGFPQCMQNVSLRHKAVAAAAAAQEHAVSQSRVLRTELTDGCVSIKIFSRVVKCNVP